jgi:hypothetical protein
MVTTETIRRMGTPASTAPIKHGVDRRWFIASKLSVDRRPHERLLMATVDLDTGERRVFGFSIVRGGSF